MTLLAAVSVALVLPLVQTGAEPPAAPRMPEGPAPRVPAAPSGPDRPALPAMDDRDPNTLTDAERTAGWILLFDGRDPGAHFRGYRRESLPESWKVLDGTLSFVPGSGSGGDIITREQYRDFEFVCDWRVGPAGNSGIMWHVTEERSHPWETGPEMQILDDAGHVDGRTPFTSAGACYALYPAPEGAVKPAGQWNRARILVQGSKVELWLNGVQTAAFDTSSSDWKQRVAESKFSSMPLFGTRETGHICLQDHGDPVSFRNIGIRPIR